MMKNSEISVITGHFGSGKTEFALNMSIKSARMGRKTVLVDLDIVNPFFRSSEVKGKLEEEGVEIIGPNYATTNVDVPSLPASIYSVFNRVDTHVIFDVGGDEDGAKALGQYYPYFKERDYRMYFVINSCRPFASEQAQVVELAHKIENASRLKLTDIVSNTNLSYETTVECILAGHEKIQGVAEELGLPITYIGVQEDLESQISKEIGPDVFPIHRYMKPLWE